MKYVYLASPYSHADPAVRLQRYHDVAKIAGWLMLSHHVVFCPITHSHQIGVALGRPVDHEFWLAQDTPLLVHASNVFVAQLEGWRISRGVAHEIDLAKQIGIPITYIDPEGII